MAIFHLMSYFDHIEGKNWDQLKPIGFYPQPTILCKNMSKSNNGRNLVNSYKFEICILNKNYNIHKSEAKENKMIRITLTI